MSNELILVPDLGSSDPVDVIEVTVQVGDVVAAEDTLVVVESDKATVEIPAPRGGTITAINVALGDSITTGDPLVEMATEAQEEEAESASPEDDQASIESAEAEPAASETASTSDVPATDGEEVPLLTPELGDIDGAELIEWLVQVGDTIAVDDLVAVLESDKASFEVPAEQAGEVLALTAELGQALKTGDVLLTLRSAGQPAAQADERPATSKPKEEHAPTAPAADKPPKSTQSTAPLSSPQAQLTTTSDAAIYAGPAVRRLARELGANLAEVKGTGVKGRVTKDDLKAHVKQRLSEAPVVAGGVPDLPSIDFSQFGPVQQEPESRLRQLAAENLHRSWLTIPAVTHQDEADVTQLEAFRRTENQRQQEGANLTLLAFLLKACAEALRRFPRFNSSLTSDGKELVLKDYVHIGIAVDTDYGLVVPVLRDVDKKGLRDIAAEVVELATKARDKRLSPADMQGGCFTISSLGGIGGGYFSPIINWPEVAILGVGRSKKQPHWDGEQFVPRDMLPLALTYDHRVVNGADAARFSRYVAEALEDMRRLLL